MIKATIICAAEGYQHEIIITVIYFKSMYKNDMYITFRIVLFRAVTNYNSANPKKRAEASINQLHLFFSLGQT